MTLLKQFTDWVTASNQTLNRCFNLCAAPPVSYLTVIAAILGISGAAAYVFTHSLNRQLNKQLLTLAKRLSPV